MIIIPLQSFQILFYPLYWFFSLSSINIFHSLPLVLRGKCLFSTVLIIQPLTICSTPYSLFFLILSFEIVPSKVISVFTLSNTNGLTLVRGIWKFWESFFLTLLLYVPFVISFSYMLSILFFSWFYRLWGLNILQLNGSKLYLISLNNSTISQLFLSVSIQETWNLDVVLMDCFNLGLLWGSLQSRPLNFNQLSLQQISLLILHFWPEY